MDFPPALFSQVVESHVWSFCISFSSVSFFDSFCVKFLKKVFTPFNFLPFPQFKSAPLMCNFILGFYVISAVSVCTGFYFGHQSKVGQTHIHTAQIFKQFQNYVPLCIHVIICVASQWNILNLVIVMRQSLKGVNTSACFKISFFKNH